MKYKDKLKFVGYELRYGKTEWIMSIFMNAVVLACCLITFIIAAEIGTVCSEYMKKMYPDGYEFEIKGFTESDTKWLEKRGFTPIKDEFSDEYECAVTQDLNNVWFHKLEALVSGKDIWEDDLDLTMEVILFGKIIFSALTIVLVIVLTNSNSNSFLMKLNERKKYISMLSGLGMSKKDCMGIYTLFFTGRNVVSLVIGCVLSALSIFGINRFMEINMGIEAGFSLVNPIIIVLVLIISTIIMVISFKKIWRDVDE